MKYRVLGKTNLKVSSLGFGGMRFPSADGKIKMTETGDMLHYAIDNGINYIDTAIFYHGGQSEPAIGELMSDIPRDKYILATKMPVEQIEKSDDFEPFLQKQLDKLRTDYIDNYLFHGIGRDKFSHILDLKLLDKAEKAKADGLIRHIGFSFHDVYDAFETIIDGYDGWEFTQIQYSYYEPDSQAGRAGVKYASERGLGIIIMSPLMGGRLSNTPQAVRDEFAKINPDMTPSEWGIKWLLDDSRISLVLSGMSSMEQLVNNISYADKYAPGSMTDAERGVISKSKEIFGSIAKIKCTGCKYCMPCPCGVDIERVFKIYNDCFAFNDRKTANNHYNLWMPKTERADMCTQCGLCEEQCPQKLDIREKLQMVHNFFTAENAGN